MTYEWTHDKIKFKGLTEIRGSHDETSAGRPQGRKYQTLTRFSRRIDLRNTLQANFFTSDRHGSTLLHIWLSRKFFLHNYVDFFLGK